MTDPAPRETNPAPRETKPAPRETNPAPRETNPAVRRVEVARVLPVEASVAYAWVADPRTHPRFVPLTIMTSPAARGPDVGDRFTMLSGPLVRRGAPGIPDTMVVDALERPSTAARRAGHTRLHKLGPVLLGEAGFDVQPLTPEHCRVVWWEDAYLAGPLPRAVTAPLVGIALRVMMRVSLRRLEVRLHGRRGR